MDFSGQGTALEDLPDFAGQGVPLKLPSSDSAPLRPDAPALTLAPSDQSKLDEARNRLLLKERIQRVESPVSSGLQESALHGVQAVTSPQGLAWGAGLAVAPAVAGPALLATTLAGVPETLQRIQKAREEGDRADYYSGVGDLLQQGLVVTGTGRSVMELRPPVGRGSVTLPRSIEPLAPEPGAPLLRPYLPPRIQPGARGSIPEEAPPTPVASAKAPAPLDLESVVPASEAPKTVKPPQPQPDILTVPDYDPQDIGARERIKRHQVSGKTRDEAITKDAADIEATRNWVESNTRSGDVIETPDGRLHRLDEDGTWYAVEDGKQKGTILSNVARLRGGKIVQRGTKVRVKDDAIISFEPPKAAPEADTARLENEAFAAANTPEGKRKYTPAIRKGDVVTAGASHEAIPGKGGERGYVDSNGNFLTLLDVARAEMEKPAPAGPVAKKPWEITREEMGQRARDVAAASKDLPEQPPELYPTLKALSDRNNRKPYNPDFLTPERMGQLGDEGLITGSPARAKITSDGFAKLNEWERLNRERDMKLGTLSDELTDKAMDEHKASVEKALREGKNVPAATLADYPDLAKPVERTLPDVIVTTKAIATGKKSRWVRRNGLWYKATTLTGSLETQKTPLEADIGLAKSLHEIALNPKPWQRVRLLETPASAATEPAPEPPAAETKVAPTEADAQEKLDRNFRDLEGEFNSASGSLSALATLQKKFDRALREEAISAEQHRYLSDRLSERLKSVPGRQPAKPLENLEQPQAQLPKGVQDSITRALKAADIIGGPVKKHDFESAYQTLRTHAARLGIEVPKLGTYFYADEYRRAAGAVRLAIGQKYGSHPTAEMQAARDAVIEAQTPSGPALTLLGLDESKFSLPSLRKLSRDTLRRLANSLGVEATVSAVARRAAVRFAEMRTNPPGPVGMGGAITAEFTGEDAPRAGTPAHAVETGPVEDRPLGPVSTTTPIFVSLAQEMLGLPSEVPPQYSVQTGLNSLAGASAPRLTALSRTAGEALVRYASSKIAAPLKAVLFSSRVLEGTGVNPVRFGAALVEDNLRSIEQEFLRQGHEANAAGHTAEADAFFERAANVKSIIGGPNSPFPDEASYQDFLHEPATQAAVARHIQEWQEDIEPQYKMAQSIDPTVTLPTRGQQTGARINLKALLPGEEPLTRPVTASRGGLTASFKRKSPFAREAKGTSDIYESSYPDIIANTYNRQLEIANQNHMNALLVEQGLARIDKPGARVMFDGQPGVPFPLSRRLILADGKAIPAGQNIYVRPEFSREYRTALNTDAPQRIPFFTQASGLFTQATIAGLGEFTTHISNLATALFTRPNSPLLWDSLAKATGRLDVPITVVRTLLKSAAKNRAQVAELAEIGVIRESLPKPTSSPYPVINALKQVTGSLRSAIEWADKKVRLMLDDAYKGLADAGLAENTETARREFINQVGQYNKRLQGQFTVLLRDTGIGPFVTAGKTFNALGIRNMLLSPGLKATTPMAAAALRANVLAGWVGFVTLAATLNYLLTRNKGGGVMGRPGVPLGNIDMGTDDKNGKPLSFPLGDALGYGRGLRITGARRLLAGQRSGLDRNQAIDSALGDVVNAALSPALGPILRSGFAAVTGRPPALNVGRSAPVVGPKQSQFAANVLDALRRANPLVNAYFDAKEGKTGWDVARSQIPRLTPQAGMTEARAEALPKVIERARFNDFMDDLARRARRLPRGDRMSFLRDEINKADLSGAERILTFRKMRSTLKYE